MVRASAASMDASGILSYSSGDTATTMESPTMVTCEEFTEPVAVFDAEGLAEAFVSLPAALGLADALAACAS